MQINNQDFWDSVFATPPKAQAILLCVVKSAGGHWRRKTTLWKAFWASHVNFTHETGAALSSHPIIRLPNGPGPARGDDLLRGLVQKGFLRERSELVGPHPCSVYEINDMDSSEKFVRSLLDSDEIAVIEKVATNLKNVSAQAASEWSHRKSNAWQRTKNGQEMNVYLDLLDEGEIKKIEQYLSEHESDLRRVIEGGSDS